MTFLLFTGFGASLSGCLLHTVLGLGRRGDRKQLVFAALLADLCIYFLYERSFYAAGTVDEAVRIARDEYPFTIAYFALFGWFIRRYTGLRIPRAVAWIYCGLLAAALVYNFAAPWGFYYSSRPRLVLVHSLGGETIHVPTAPLGVVTLLYYLLFIALHSSGVAGGAHLARRGDRLRGVIFAIGVGFPLITVLIDLAHELVGAGWPYFTEFGMVGLSIILSVQLAVDFRSKEAELEVAFAELKQHAARTNLLAEVTWLLSQIRQHRRVLEELAKLCLRDLADWCVIDLQEHDRLRRVVTLPPGAKEPSTMRDVVQTVLGTGAPLISSSSAGARTLLAVPLAAGGTRFGVITLGSHRPERYSDAERSLAEELAGRAALAIENARLAEFESRAIERLARVALAVKDMANTPLQILEIDLALLERYPGHPSAIERMRRAVVRLKGLDAVLTTYSAPIRWRKEDESFDPVEVIKRGGVPQGGDER